MPVTNNTKPKDDLGGFSSYEQKYSSMKTNLKVLLYENELFQDELRKLQRELLDIYRDKESLLEKVIQFEDIGSSSSDSESLSSDNECDTRLIECESQVVVQSTIDSNNKPQQKTPTASKRQNGNASVSATAAKRNNQAKTVHNANSSKPKANGSLPKKAPSTTNGKANSNGTAKADKKPVIASQTVEVKKGLNKAEQATKPKAVGRARSKPNANKNTTKVAPVISITTSTSTSATTTATTAVIAPSINSLPQMTPASMSQTVEMHQSQQQQHHPHQQHHHLQPHHSNPEQPPLHIQIQQQQPITQHALPQPQAAAGDHYQCIQQQVATYPGYHIAAAPGHIQAQTHVQLVQLHPHSHQAHHQMLTADMISVAHPVHARQPNLQQQQIQQQTETQQIQQQSSGQEHHQIIHHQQHQPQPPPQHHHHLQHQQQQQQQQQQQNQQHQHQPQQQQHHHQQQQHQPQQPTQQQQTQHQHQLMTEQLSAEELEQYLEARRMEQAALLLPDWESSVPSEIFSADSGIKFMAED